MQIVLILKIIPTYISHGKIKIAWSNENSSNCAASLPLPIGAAVTFISFKVVVLNWRICQWWGVENRLFYQELLRLLAFPLLPPSSFSPNVSSQGLRWKDLLDSLLSIGQVLSGVLSVKILRFHLNLKQTCRLGQRGRPAFRETELFFNNISQELHPQGQLQGNGWIAQNICSCWPLQVIPKEMVTT